MTKRILITPGFNNTALAMVEEHAGGSAEIEMVESLEQLNYDKSYDIVVLSDEGINFNSHRCFKPNTVFIYAGSSIDHLTSLKEKNYEIQFVPETENSDPHIQAANQVTRAIDGLPPINVAHFAPYNIHAGDMLEAIEKQDDLFLDNITVLDPRYSFSNRNYLYDICQMLGKEVFKHALVTKPERLAFQFTIAYLRTLIEIPNEQEQASFIQKIFDEYVKDEAIFEKCEAHYEAILKAVEKGEVDFKNEPKRIALLPENIRNFYKTGKAYKQIVYPAIMKHTTSRLNKALVEGTIKMRKLVNPKEARLITIIGAPGSGKSTMLAHQMETLEEGASYSVISFDPVRPLLQPYEMIPGYMTNCEICTRTEACFIIEFQARILAEQIKKQQVPETIMTDLSFPLQNLITTMIQAGGKYSCMVPAVSVENALKRHAARGDKTQASLGNYRKLNDSKTVIGFHQKISQLLPDFLQRNSHHPAQLILYDNDGGKKQEMTPIAVSNIDSKVIHIYDAKRFCAFMDKANANPNATTSSELYRKKATKSQWFKELISTFTLSFVHKKHNKVYGYIESPGKEIACKKLPAHIDRVIGDMAKSVPDQERLKALSENLSAIKI